KNDTKPVSSDGVSSHDMLVPTDTVDGKADSKGDTVIPVDVFQDDATMFVPIDTTENSIDVPKATNENVITTSTCDQDGDGIITDNFKNYYFLIAIRNALGKKFNADITLQDVLKTTSLNLSSSGLQSLPNILGIECFTELTVLDLSINSEISDITPLAGLTKLTYLDLSFTGISNNLAPLKNLINLTTLYLFASGISDVTSLAGLTKLQDLVLSSNNLSDLTPLKDFTNLIYVDFWDNMISDVTPLAGLIKLQELTIGNQKGSEVVSDVTALAGLINLTRLELPNNEISDITPLAGLTNLTHLTLEGNKISDVTPLAALTKLEFLYLDNNQISDVTSFTGLINLWFLELRFNLLYDLTPLLNNPGINFGDKACILGNPNVPQSQIKALVNKGVNVICSPSY
ncbi:TPA: leucine-rich repeat domain-containing protein, partial [Candidatus Micrarchaeota archaeon]|nr:leucine-rich repeat domain-containing protein [Candidatus Micrarchaeota archaeon]